jgi:hypothetical protein
MAKLNIQQTINKRESKLSDMIETATGGGKLVNKDLFDTPAKRERFRKMANDPSYVEFVDGDEMSRDRAIQYINSAQYPNQIIEQLGRMWDVVDRISKVPASIEAISENSNESGILFERKIQVSRINTITLMNRIKNFHAKAAEAYFWQFQTSYNGTERHFSTPDGKKAIILNRRVFNPKDGKIYVQNRPDQIPRCQVICTESKSSPNKTIRDRAIYSEMYNLSTQTNPEYASLFFKLIIKTMELDEKEKDEVLEISKIQQMRDRLRIETEIMGLMAQASQSQLVDTQTKMALQQMLQQAQQGAPEEIPTQETPEDEIPQGEFIDPGMEESEMEQEGMADEQLLPADRA